MTHLVIKNFAEHQNFENKNVLILSPEVLAEEYNFATKKQKLKQNIFPAVGEKILSEKGERTAARKLEEF